MSMFNPPLRNLPCPFCGSEQNSAVKTMTSETIRVHCEECHATAPLSKWNERFVSVSDQRRHNVFDAINSERDYQARKWGEKPHEVDAFVAYIAEYTGQLLHVAGTSGDTLEKLNAVRKVGALAVACMEQHGAPRRE